MAHQNYYSSPAAASCPAPMTRAALLALRAAGSLQQNCHYTITDHVQNRLVAGTTITLHAVSANELSERAEVNTTYDNEAWAGIYDLDRAIVLELTDNRGNVAKGFNGAEVANFDWGNPAYTGSRVENATWTVTYGNTAQMLRVSVSNGAALNTTGFTGAMQDARIHTVVTVNLTNANGTWRYSEWKNSGTFNAFGYTGAGDSYYNEFDQCNISLVGQTGVATFRSSELQSCTINVAGASPFSILGSQFYTHTINRPATGGPTSINQCSSREAGSFTISGSGTLSATGTQNNGSIRLVSTGGITINYCSLDQTCDTFNGGSALLTMTRTTQQGGASNVTLDAGSSTPTTVNDCEIRNGGIIRVVGAVGGGAFTVTASRVDSGAFIYKRNTGALSVTQSQLSGSSGLDAQSGTRSYNVVRLTATEVSRATFTGTGAVTDTINDINMSVRAGFAISCSGAANSILYSTINGLSGSLQFTGTTGGQTVNRLKMQDGSISFANCTTNTQAQLCTAVDFGRIIFSGISSPKTFSYLHAENQGTIALNNSTGAGSVSIIKVSNVGSYTLSGTAATAQRLDIAQGAVAHNGGSLQQLHKRLTGTLTTGNFNHTGIIHHMNVSRTLTATNTNRGEYQGLAAGAYTATGILI